MRMALAITAMMALAGCATTPNDIAKLPPAYTGHTSKSVQEYAGCIAPKMGKFWPFTQSLPIEDGIRIVGQASMSIPKAMLIVDIVKSGSGAQITYTPKSVHIPKDNERAVKSCM